jgi:hypothetical protein
MDPTVGAAGDDGLDLTGQLEERFFEVTLDGSRKRLTCIAMES